MGDVTILFSPTGAVVSVVGMPVTDPIYLMIGKRARIANSFVTGNPNETTLTNWQDLNNLWVTINPQTGMVNTEAVAAAATPALARTGRQGARNWRKVT